MVLKKSTTLFSSCSHLPNFYCPAEIPYTSLPTHPSCTIKPQRRRRSIRRYYATVHADQPSSSPDAAHDHLQWPTSSSNTSTIPSPYQILHQNPRKPYSKHCFYKLVKVYHPDRSKANQDESHDHIRRLPGHIKMERYRLIVAANDILSDPAKRKAYDRYGAGWNGRMQEQVYTWRERSTSSGGGASTSESRWSGFDTNDSPFANATWEDWERWYKRHQRTKPEPLYTSNGGFLSLVALALVVGGIGQGMQVDRHQDLFSAQAEIRHRNAGHALVRHRETAGRTRGDVDERIQGFLRARDEAGYGFGEGVERKMDGVGGDEGDEISEGSEQQPMVMGLSDGILQQQQQQQDRPKKQKRRKDQKSSYDG